MRSIRGRFKPPRIRPLGQLAQAKAQLAQANAGLVQAQAQLLSAEANQRKAQLDEDRYTPLAQQQAITQQDLDNARQTNRSLQGAGGRRAGAGGDRKSADRGRPGRSRPPPRPPSKRRRSISASPSSPRPSMASPAPPPPRSAIWSARRATPSPPFRRSTPSKPTSPSASRSISASLRSRFASYASCTLDLILSDGTVYPHKGRFSFADRQVDPSTGAIQLTGLFPNPGNMLRPGQYGKGARHASAFASGALLVPQRSVTERRAAIWSPWSTRTTPSASRR